MWIKGIGGDLAHLKIRDVPLCFYKSYFLTKMYRGREHEDEMVALFNHCIYDLDSKSTF